MKKIARVGTTILMGAAMALGMAAPAQAAEALMRNNPATYAYGICGGDVRMSLFYTERADIYWATYEDQYRKSDGTWWWAGYQHTLHDSWAAGQVMGTGFLNGTPIRVRADHHVYTRQGPGCSQA